MDPSAFPVAGRVGRAVGEQLNSAGDPAVRRALSLAVDRESLVEHVLAGHGRPATSPITDAYPEFEPVGVWAGTGWPSHRVRRMA